MKRCRPSKSYHYYYHYYLVLLLLPAGKVANKPHEALQALKVLIPLQSSHTVYKMM